MQLQTCTCVTALQFRSSDPYLVSSTWSLSPCPAASACWSGFAGSSRWWGARCSCDPARHSSVHCVELYRVVQLCTYLYKVVQGCIGLYRVVQLCTELYRVVPEVEEINYWSHTGRGKDSVFRSDAAPGPCGRPWGPVLGPLGKALHLEHCKLCHAIVVDWINVFVTGVK